MRGEHNFRVFFFMVGPVGFEPYRNVFLIRLNLSQTNIYRIDDKLTLTFIPTFYQYIFRYYIKETSWYAD